MKIYLNELAHKDKIEISKEIDFPKEYLTGDIKELKNVYVNGFFYENDLGEYLCKLNVKGIMMIPDSFTLDLVPYDFDFIIDDSIEENLEKSENTLDILEFLWQNIVLEEPISYSISDAKNVEGSGWKIKNDDDEDEIDPRLEKLKEIYKGGE